MAITDKEQGVWNVDQVYNKINEGDIWAYTGETGLWSVGSGSNGISAQNDTVNRSSPIQIPGTTWSTELGKIAVTPYNNRYHAGAIKTDGTLWVWGNNNDGTLGLNDKTQRSSPIQLPGTWSTVSASYESFLGQKTDGTLWTWGFNDSGSALGHNQSGYPASVSSPKQVGTDTTWAPGGVMAKENGMVAKTDGSLWTWGKNSYGILGINVAYSPSNKGRSSPVQIPGTTWNSGAGKIAMVEYGNIASVIKTDGTLWAWGSNQNGALGQNNKTPHSSPVQIGADTTWTNIMHNGDGMFFATKTDNTLWGWGNNHADWKLLGLGDAVSQSSPTQIGTGTDWNRPNSVGYQCNVISKTDGTLWATGSPQRNVIGLNGTGSANPANNGSPIQCGGDDWIESKGSLYYMIGTQTK